MAGRLAAAALLLFSALVPAAAGTTDVAESTRIGERLYVVLYEHDPIQFSNALRAGADFLDARPGRRFEVIMDYYGLFAAIPGVTTVQREYADIRRRHPGLSVVVCKETFEKLARMNKRKLSVLPGMQILPCKDRRQALEKAGWRPALGF